MIKAKTKANAFKARKKAKTKANALKARNKPKARAKARPRARGYPLAQGRAKARPRAKRPRAKARHQGPQRKSKSTPNKEGRK